MIGGRGRRASAYAGRMATAAPSAWNAANAVTAVRIALVPVFLVLLLADDGGSVAWRCAAAGVFALAALSDRLDGYLARHRGLVTDFGKIADPIADKLLMGSALIGLNVLGELPVWVTVVILVREVGITVMRLALLRHVVIPASRGGKLKTATQSVGIGLFVLPLERWWEPAIVVAWAILLVAVVLTVVTGVDYVRGAMGARRVERAA